VKPGAKQIEDENEEEVIPEAFTESSP